MSQSQYSASDSRLFMEFRKNKTKQNKTKQNKNKQLRILTAMTERRHLQCYKSGRYVINKESLNPSPSIL